MANKTKYYRVVASYKNRLPARTIISIKAKNETDAIKKVKAKDGVHDAWAL